MVRAFRNLRIAIKAMLPLVILAVVALGAGGVASTALIDTQQAYSGLLNREAAGATQAVRLNALVTDLARTTWRTLAFPEPETIAEALRIVEGSLAEGQTRAAPIRPIVADTPQAADLQRFERDYPAVVEVALQGLRLLRDGRAEEGRQFLRAELRPRVDALRKVTAELSQVMATRAGARAAALQAEADATVRNVLLVLGFGIAGSLGTAIWMTRAGIVRPLDRLHGSMRGLAAGDLAIQVEDTERGDEIGGMAQALGGLAAGLREAATLRQEQEALKQRAEHERRAATLELANVLERSVGGVVEGIASATTELSAAATSMVDIAESTSTRAATVSGATSLASGNVGTVAAATEELAASVAEISRQVADSARMAAGAVDQANRTNTTVANLTEAAAKIGEVTRLIGDIAGQTNLLALNATIEAARAGEAGKGFAVVASEVKALANQTAQATGSIATQIQAMQAATQDAAADIGAIRESIGQINQVTAAIAAAVEEQGAATRDIAENVQRAAQGTAEITSAIEGVTAAAGETGGAASQVQATSATLAQQAETLRAEVGNFLGRVRAA